MEYVAIEFIDDGLICTIIVGTCNCFPNGLSCSIVCQPSSIGRTDGCRLNTFPCEKTIFVFFSHKDLDKLGP
ncbi:hypothetical protein ACOSP7_031473 [Xanthoceras sorbifolium]